MKNRSEPAAPAKVTINRETGEFQPFQFGNNDFEAIGLTKREHFAGKQMAAIQSNLGGTMSDQGGIKWMAEIAVKQADALLAELERAQ